MDYILDIIIPKKEIELVNMNEKLFEWGDSVYSCEPLQYVTDSNIIFEQVENIQYYNRIVGENIPNDMIVLNLKSDILFDLEYAVNNDEATLKKNELYNFLVELFRLSKFYIFLIREDEKVKERYEIATKEEIGVRLSNSLRWSDPKDVFLFKIS